MLAPRVFAPRSEAVTKSRHRGCRPWVPEPRGTNLFAPSGEPLLGLSYFLLNTRFSVKGHIRVIRGV